MIGSEFNLELDAQEQKYLEERTLHAELSSMQANEFTDSQQAFMQNFNPNAVDVSKEQAILVAAFARAKESVNARISAVKAHMEEQDIFSILEAQAEKRAPGQKDLLDSLYEISNNIFIIELGFKKEASFLRTFEQLTNLVHQSNGVLNLYELRFGETEDSVMALAMREQHLQDGAGVELSQVAPLPVAKKPKPLKRSMGTANFANMIVTPGEADEKIIDKQDRLVYHAPPKGKLDFLPWRRKKREQEILQGQMQVDARNVQIDEENRQADEENKNISRRNMLRDIAKKKMLIRQDEGIIDAVIRLKGSWQDEESRAELNAINTAADNVIEGLSKRVSKQTFTKQSEDVLKAYNVLVEACTAHKTEHAGSKNKDLVRQILSIAKSDINGIKKATIESLGADETSEMTFMTALERAVRTERIDLTNKKDVKRVGAATSTRLQFNHNGKTVFFTQEDVLQDYPGIMTPVLDAIMNVDYEEKVRIIEQEVAAEPALFTDQEIATEQARAEEPALFTDDEQTQSSDRIDIPIYKEKVKAITKGMEDFAKSKNYANDSDRDVINIFASAGDEMKGYDNAQRIMAAQSFFGIGYSQNPTTKPLKYAEGITLSSGEWKLFADDLTDLLGVYAKTHIQRQRLLNVGDNITVRNAAMSRVAELLSAGDLLARSTTAEVTMDGKILRGNLMEAAHGSTPVEIKAEYNKNIDDYNEKLEKYNADKKAYEEKERKREIERIVQRRYVRDRDDFILRKGREPDASYEDRRKAKLRESIAKNISEDSLEYPFEELPGIADRINELIQMYETINATDPEERIANASMQRNMVRLQMLDTLCMQVDRHLNNFFIAPTNANENQISRVEGIDNDLAFLPEGEIIGFGFFLPNFLRTDGTTTLPVVDAEMADAILALTPATLLLAIGDSIPAEERTALIGRLKKMQDALIATREERPHIFIKKEDWGKDTLRRLQDKSYANYYRTLIGYLE
jgi:hypothetical protein